jgi:glycosyltransferase involved in cell wall biosynthesis
MRVLQVGSGVSPPTFIRRQIQEVTRAGIEVDNFDTLAKVSGWRRRLISRGLFWAAPNRLRTVFRECDVAHFQWPGHYFTWGSMARHSRRPTVLSLRGRQANILPFLPGNELYRARLGNCLREVFRVHCVSDQMAEIAVSLGADSSRIRVIRPAVDTMRFVPRVRAKNARPRVAMIGSLMWRKGYEYALLAVRTVLDRGIDIELAIAGEGPDRSHVEFMRSELGLESHVNFLGQFEEDAVLELLQSSDVFLHTSLSEGISNGAIEAMACGLPIVTTDVGGMPEAVQHGRHGLVVPPRDSYSLADALGQLLDSRDLRMEMGASGRSRAVEEFNVRDQGHLFVAMYREAVA